MRIVAGEHVEFGHAVLDHPAHVLVRERGEAHGALDVVGRLHVHRLQIGIGFRERDIAVIQHAQEFGHPSRAAFDHPAAQVGEALEHAVIDQRGQEFLRRVPQAHEIGETQVLAPAVQVGRTLAAVVHVAFGLALGARPDMQLERDPVVLQILPERVEVGVARRTPARRLGGEHHCAGALADREFRFFQRALRIVQRAERHRDQPLVRVAEIDLRQVQRARGGIGLVLGLGAGDRRQPEGREHQLAVEAQPVERLDAFLLVEAAIAEPALGPLDRIGGDLGAFLGVALPRLGRVDHLDDALAALALGIHLRVFFLVLALEIGGQPVLRFHGVGIRVIHDAPADIGHKSLLYVLAVTVQASAKVERESKDFLAGFWMAGGGWNVIGKQASYQLIRLSCADTLRMTRQRDCRCNGANHL